MSPIQFFDVLGQILFQNAHNFCISYLMPSRQDITREGVIRARTTYLEGTREGVLQYINTWFENSDLDTPPKF